MRDAGLRVGWRGSPDRDGELSLEGVSGFVDELFGTELVQPFLALFIDEDAIEAGALADGSRAATFAGPPIVYLPLAAVAVAKEQDAARTHRGVGRSSLGSR